MSANEGISSTDESIGFIRCPYQCTIGDCKLTFKRKDGLDRHIYSHTKEKTYKCTKDNCDKLYICQTHLRRHIKEFHDKKPRRLVKIKCKHEACLLEFNTENQMQNHYTKLHSSLKKYKCDVCNVGYNHKMQFKRHMIQHNVEYPYKCDICCRSFITLKKKKVHIKIHHTDIKCNDCNKEFETWANYMLHRKIEHRKVYTCETCKRPFYTKFDLKKHSQIHISILERNIFACNYEKCSKFYLNEKNLIFHIKSKHEGVKYKCTYDNCTSELVTKQKLQQHLKIHEKRKVYRKRKNNNTKRKDFGLKKISTASKIAGVINENKIEKLIINGNSDAVYVLQANVELNESSAATDTEVETNENKKEILTELSFIDTIETKKINYKQSLEDNCKDNEIIKTI